LARHSRSLGSADQQSRYGVLPIIVSSNAGKKAILKTTEYPTRHGRPKKRNRNSRLRDNEGESTGLQENRRPADTQAK
jgi:hypothetical protein